MSKQYDKMIERLEELEKIKNDLKERDLNNTERLPKLTEDEIIQLGLDVIEKCDKFPWMIRFSIFHLMEADERAMYAVKKWLETVK